MKRGIRKDIDTEGFFKGVGTKGGGTCSPIGNFKPAAGGDVTVFA